ncbi:serine/arginine-rich SC35-like splicing factor SCL33 isoform X3 [Phragmites australis]|uniref:serine/arginine-rich SC35-like splicing factor SCL33 isoform X3 n=1 Tax=Phragmites australis TaxID=29695 RepID=UPI002D781B3D|nr:serine/arginine-rich SC35-like splicing factor SCL33 isoform X3 [Phragmites australis]XP_062215499.1 serine/arginine-rich SC35-like splicing factor SCL33 isoform X3 [Phragmites australis]
MGRTYDYSPSPPRGYRRSPSLPRGYRRSPSLPRGYRRRARSPSPHGRYGGRARDLPTSLLVRNLNRDCRPDDLRRPFGKFGRLKDIYLPRDYYTGGPRGFGFIQYFDPEDAADAKYHMDGQNFLGRAITVVFAEENRKKPSEMRARERVSGRSCSYDRRSRSRSPGNSYSPRGRSRSRSRSYSPAPKRKHHSRSRPPRERSVSHSPVNSRSRSASPALSRSPRRQRSLSVSQ